MMYKYWEKQSTSKPLYPQLEWEKPERKDLAGKLLIIGGSAGSFRGVAEAYSISKTNGIGEVKALIPESLRKITKDLPDISYAYANASGSFSIQARDTLLYAAQWSDGVLLSGEYGRNSESSIALSTFLKQYSGIAVLTKDAIDLLNSEMAFLASRPKTTLVCSYSQLQKIGNELNDKTPFRFKDDLVQVVEHLHEFTSKNSFNVVTKHGDFLIVSSSSNVITTERQDLDELWCLKKASEVVVNSIHFSSKSAITSLAYSSVL